MASSTIKLDSMATNNTVVTGDFNNYIDNGIYEVYGASNISNAPSNVNYGLMLVMAWPNKNALVQIVCSITNGAVAYRNYNNNWDSWKSLTFT